VIVPVNLTHAGPLVYFQFSGSGTVADPAKYDSSAGGSITPVNTTNAGPLTFFQFFGSGTFADPFTL
jgi:hypothetical protein